MSKNRKFVHLIFRLFLSIEANYRNTRAPALPGALSLLNHYAETCRRADVFSRGGLEQTFRLLRKSHPALALTVQNVLHQIPIKKPEEFAGDRRTDNFLIDLEGEQIQAILEALVSLADVNKLRKINGNVTELGNLVIVKSLIQDWILVAQAYIQKTRQAHDFPAA